MWLVDNNKLSSKLSHINIVDNAQSLPKNSIFPLGQRLGKLIVLACKKILLSLILGKQRALIMVKQSRKFWKLARNMDYLMLNFFVKVSIMYNFCSRKWYVYIYIYIYIYLCVCVCGMKEWFYLNIVNRGSTMGFQII